MSSKKHTIIVSKRAVSMMRNHACFLANVSKEAANEFVDLFRNKIKALEFMPQRNPYLNHSELPQNKYRKLVIKKRYIVIYQIKRNNVYVDYIVDSRQDYGWIL
ncbi:MAG: type II toxin-antitoxin system RelE/ParE family toxin [Clostridiales bacterium]|nr:type II toxin-antitoxin system RelE/ParE family toxin [Clostridiales bacterium]